MKQLSQSEKQMIWPAVLDMILLCLAGLVFYTYWEGMIVPVLFINKTLLTMDLILGVFLCGIFLLLGLQSLGFQTAKDSNTSNQGEFPLQEKDVLEVFIAAINFMLSIVVFSLLILTCLVDLNILRPL